MWRYSREVVDLPIAGGAPILKASAPGGTVRVMRHPLHLNIRSADGGPKLGVRANCMPLAQYGQCGIVSKPRYRCIDQSATPSARFDAANVSTLPLTSVTIVFSS
jgi:hypothetical protein